MKAKIFLFLLLCLILRVEVSAQSAIYACGHIRRQRDVAIDNLRNSGYTTVILFNVTVEPDGTLTTDYNWSMQAPAEAGGIICKDGKYVFDEYQPYYKEDVKMIVSPPTSVERLEICIGGWTNGSYGNIKKLIEKEGTGTESILYRNFKALKEALPDVEAVNNDQEQDYDVNTAIEFHKMMFELGYKTTIAPYTRQAYWKQMVEELNSEKDICDRIYLQMYGGGSSNQPSKWQVFGDIPMYIGFDCEVSSNMNTMNSTFNKWKDTPNVEGGFLWNYNNEDRNHNQWASAINRIFRSPEIETPAVTLFEKSNFGGYAVQLGEGIYTAPELAVRGMASKDISSFVLGEGYKITLFKQPDLTGDFLTWDKSAETLPAPWDNQASSVIIEADPNGIYSPDLEELKITGDSDGLIIRGLRLEDSVTIFSLSGNKVFEEKGIEGSVLRIANKNLTTGIYIIKIADKSYKFLNNR